MNCYSKHMPRQTAPAVIAFVLLAAFAAAQSQPGVHPVSGRRYAGVMGWQGAQWLDRPEREMEEEPQRAIEALSIPRGAVVADVGAGSGYMTVRLADKVGPSGRVYASDIQPEMLQMLDARLKKEKITNVTLVQGTLDDPKLPPDTLDLILMVDVYHEFSEPQKMLRAMYQSLKPGGRIVLLEYRKEDPSIPIRIEHKMSVQEARQELQAEGFQFVRVDGRLPRQHILIFSRP